MRLSLLQRAENAHDDSVWACAWAPSSNVLVTGSVDESAKLWQEAGDTLEQRHHLVGACMGCMLLWAGRSWVGRCRAAVGKAVWVARVVWQLWRGLARRAGRAAGTWRCAELPACQLPPCTACSRRPLLLPMCRP